jgi:asparagine synthase (glutamine-hydrolysing)
LSLRGERPSREDLITMSRALAHRGPDGWGVEELGACGLAHRRLSIIDLSPLGRQPMSDREGRFTITYNGEVYNYVELRRELEAQGVRFRSETDTEVILAAFHAYGLEAFARMNGMWGLAIWDALEKRLILSRDRMGVKPLYLYRSPERILFASEVKAMLAIEPSLGRVDRMSLARFLEWGVVGYGKDTIFERVERLDPGTAAIIDATGAIQTHRYWSFRPPEMPERVSVTEGAERVRELLTDSVRLRFRSDVPVGTCLSGGLDSSSIVALSKLRVGKAPQTFSVLYDDPEFSETSFVRTMSQRLELEANETAPDGSDLPDVFERCAYFQEEPSGGPGLYSQWHVMKLAAPKVKVLLDGQGGDELFGGYFGYFVPYVKSLLARAAQGDVAIIPEIIRADLEIHDLTGDHVLPDLFKHRLRMIRAQALRKLRARVRDTPLGEAARTLRGLLQDSKGGRWMDRGGVASGDLSRLVESERKTWAPPTVTGDGLRDLLWDQLVRSSIPALLHYEDRNSMAFSIEARVPFLDYRLVELAFSLPVECLIQGARTKVVLREAMSGILPESIRERRDKKGYPTPFSIWLRNPVHSDWIRDLLFSRRVRERGWIRTEVASTLLSRHNERKADHSWHIWKLMALELFARRFIDGPFVLDRPPANVEGDGRERVSP